ncbi:putative lipid-transfer protein DIR1 [Durio zibethinus]|uniref:Lipid-transfer protein DIR1 n=1 Tax=Durio zibethinus TaxID=66656 RepID=A0A6P6AXF5_DURZI|nr:putative lipid-transfer protein DIR1 [Durio zibethinus]
MATGKLVVLMMIMVALIVEGSRAITLCDMNDDGLEACKPSVTQPNPVDPSPECCEALKGANLTCLCGYKNSLLLPSIGIDPALALALPPKCKLEMPPDC